MITQDSLVNFEYNNETLLGIVVSECDYSIRQLAHERKLPEQVFHVLASNGAYYVPISKLRLADDKYNQPKHHDIYRQ
jgi:hypothetical protein